MSCKITSLQRKCRDVGGELHFWAAWPANTRHSGGMVAGCRLARGIPKIFAPAIFCELDALLSHGGSE